MTTHHLDHLSTMSRRPSRPTAGSFVRRRPLLTFSVTVVVATWAVQLGFLALGWPLFPALIIELVILLAVATGVAHATDGRAGVRGLYSQAVRWRLGLGTYAALILALPTATLLIGAVTGTLSGPADGWASEVLLYLFLTLVFGALLGNIWEELAWTGFLQDRLTGRQGLVRAAVWTSVPFGLIHLPLAFEADGLTGTALGDVALTWAVLLAVAPFFRVLVGLVHLRTGRSVLAVAILHGSFNACASMSLTPGGWQFIPATVLVTLVAAGFLLRAPGMADR